MDSRITKIAVFIIASAIFLFGIYSLLKDLAYFATKRYTVGLVEEVVVTEAHNPNIVVVKFVNEYLGREVIGNIKVQKSFSIKKGNSTEISYSRWFQNNVYIRQYKEPRFLVVFFDLFLLFLMAIAISATKGSVFSEGKSVH